MSAVNVRPNSVADLAVLRETMGDRLLVVDGIQGFGVVDLDWTLADALVMGGQKWLPARWGAGFRGVVIEGVGASTAAAGWLDRC